MKYTSAYLTGGSSAEDTAATWAAVSDASLRITVNGTAYNVDAIDFSGLTTMAQVAALIQTDIRTATSGTETVTWDTDHFVINAGDTTYESVITALETSTGTVGTDISGNDTTLWMDCADNATVTEVSASAGMDVEDIYQDVARELFDDSTDTTIDANKFRRWLNDGYRIVLNRADLVDPNWHITIPTTSTRFDITASSTDQEQTFALATYAANCQTIIRVDYLPDNAVYDDDYVPIPETEYDEKDSKHNLRWCRQGSNLIIRGITDDLDDVGIHFSSRRESLIADSDIPTFPNMPQTNDYHSILVDYCIARYYRWRNMETRSDQFMGDPMKPSGDNFYGRLQDMLDAIEPTDEPIILKPKVEEGIPGGLPNTLETDI